MQTTDTVQNFLTPELLFKSGTVHLEIDPLHLHHRKKNF